MNQEQALDPGRQRRRSTILASRHRWRRYIGRESYLWTGKIPSPVLCVSTATLFGRRCCLPPHRAPAQTGQRRRSTYNARRYRATSQGAPRKRPSTSRARLVYAVRLGGRRDKGSRKLGPPAHDARCRRRTYTRLHRDTLDPSRHSTSNFFLHDHNFVAIDKPAPRMGEVGDNPFTH